MISTSLDQKVDTVSPAVGCSIMHRIIIRRIRLINIGATISKKEILLKRSELLVQITEQEGS